MVYVKRGAFVFYALHGVRERKFCGVSARCVGSLPGYGWLATDLFQAADMCVCVSESV